MAVNLLFQIAAGFLVVEMVVVLLLLNPFVKATTWVHLYNSSVWSKVRETVNKTFRAHLKYQYFLVALMAIVTVSFLDSAHDVYKMYFPDKQQETIEIAGNPCAVYMKEERYYRESKTLLITGFTLYLTVVLLLLRDAIADKAGLETKIIASTSSESGKELIVQESSPEDVDNLKKSKLEITIELNETKEALSKAMAELAEMKDKYDNAGSQSGGSSTEHQVEQQLGN